MQKPHMLNIKLNPIQMKIESNKVMKNPTLNKKCAQGFTLVELMVGMLIGLIGVLVIANVFINFDSQRRSISGTADAQVNGAVGLYHIQRDLAMAGYGFPIYGDDYNALNCPLAIPYVNGGTTVNLGTAPVLITDGGTGSDSISIRRATTPTGGAQTQLLGSDPLNNKIALLKTNLGFENPINASDANFAWFIHDDASTSCSFARVEDVSTTAQTIQISRNVNTIVGSPRRVGFIDTLLQNTYSINANNQLVVETSNGFAAGATNILVGEIVSIQARYGLSDTPQKPKVTTWQDATGTFSATNMSSPTGSVTNKNRIKAIRIAIVARDGQIQRSDVTTTAPVSWAGGPTIDLSANPDWKKYRYRVYQTVIPVRNSTYSRARMK